MHQEMDKIQKDVLDSNLINESDERFIRMKGSTLKKCLDIGAMRSTVLERIKRLSDENDLEITVKSGIAFGDHADEDWIVFTHNPAPVPDPEWFDKMLSRDYESEREVETYFIAPLLEKLGYNYEDIVIDYPIESMKGSRREKPKHADLFYSVDMEEMRMTCC